MSESPSIDPLPKDPDTLGRLVLKLAAWAVYRHDATLQSPQDREDAVSDVVVRMIGYLDRVAVVAQLAKLASTIARNVEIDRLRKLGHHKLEGEPDWGVWESRFGEFWKEVEAERRPEADPKIATAIVRTIEQLPPELREIVILRFARGLDLGSIAARMGISPSTASRRHAEALRILGSELLRRATTDTDLDAAIAKLYA